MKILIGICGIGNGHLNRQTSVIEYLIANGHEIIIATTNNNIDYFKKRFPEADVLEISIPWIACNEKGIDFSTSMQKYKESKIDLFESFLDFSMNIERCSKGIPDIVITDYEPNVAQYSYAVGKPLICMEQQSKFLYLDEIKIKNFSILEERKRINYFFPKFDCKIISSFFPIKISDRRVKVVTPIICKLKRKQNKNDHILIYFSPYDNSENYAKILEAANTITGRQVIVYTKEKFSQEEFKNITFKSYSCEFKHDLEDAYCLISTAGHQLLSEAISISVPAYLIPLNTYEQNYNAKMIEKYNLGMIADRMDSDELKAFLENVSQYADNIREYRSNHYRNGWQKQLLKSINQLTKK